MAHLRIMMKLSWLAPLTSQPPIQMSRADATRLEATTTLPALLLVSKLPVDQHVYQVRAKLIKPFTMKQLYAIQ